MKQISVLITDDSQFARGLMKAILSEDEEVVVTGEAANGREAVEKNMELKPDIITMDMEMPVMDGLEAIEQIMALRAVPILVVTTHSDAKTAFSAISRGALDLIDKSSVNIEDAREFIKKIKILSKVKVFPHIKGKMGAGRKPDVQPAAPRGKASPDRVVAIASSTGGPDALSVILSMLPGNFPYPVVVAQHIADGFAKGMAEWIGSLSKVKVKMAEADEILSRGVAYISPSEKHMVVNGSRRISLVGRRPFDIYHPSCDMLLSSVAGAFGGRSIGVILTGMGHDGAMGIKDIKKAGGLTIAQDEKTSVVFGMPKAAIDSGFVDKVLPVESIGRELAIIAGM